MLTIRMQRTGRKGHAQFRVVVQDSRQSPSSHKVVAQLGNYDPHTKAANIDKEKVEFYLNHGAQPSDRAAILFKKEGVKLPKWVSVDTKKQGELRNPEKLRKNRPADAEAKADKPDEPADEVAVETPTTEATTEEAAPVEDAQTEVQPDAAEPAAEEKASETEASAVEEAKEEAAVDEDEAKADEPVEAEAKEEPVAEEKTESEQPEEAKTEPEDKK